jgi:hypothetical protein
MMISIAADHVQKLHAIQPGLVVYQGFTPYGLKLGSPQLRLVPCLPALQVLSFALTATKKHLRLDTSQLRT